MMEQSVQNVGGLASVSHDHLGVEWCKPVKDVSIELYTCLRPVVGVVIGAGLSMKSDKSHPDYFFGNTDVEHECLIRQANRLAPGTERFFRDAGIVSGHRVLELAPRHCAQVIVPVQSW
jgi:hypothetical protein